MRYAIATIALLGALVVLGLAAIAVGEAVPDGWVAGRLHDATVDGALDDGLREPTRLGNRADQATECVAVSIGLGEAPDAGFVETILESPHLGPCPVLVEAVQRYEVAGDLPEGSSYLRYWHGTSGFFRVTIAAVGVSALRTLLFLMTAAALVGLAHRVARLASWVAGVALVAPLVLTSDFVELSGVAHHSAAMFVTLGSAYVTLMAVERDLRPIRVWLMAVLTGAVFAYIDLLTHVPGAWILPPSMVLLAGRIAGLRPGRLVHLGLLSGAGWLAGYAGMWASKWVLAAIWLGRQRVVDDVRDTIEFRLDGESPYSEQGLGIAVGDNMSYWLDRPLTGLLLVVAAAIVLARLRAVVRRGTSALTDIGAAALPALVPFAWFEILSNHSQIHHWYTYRSLPIALGVLLLAVLADADRPAEPGRALKTAPVA